MLLHVSHPVFFNSRFFSWPKTLSLKPSPTDNLYYFTNDLIEGLQVCKGIPTAFLFFLGRQREKTEEDEEFAIQDKLNSYINTLFRFGAQSSVKDGRRWETVQ